MFNDISKESNAVLISMYKRYLEQRKVGEPRFSARYFEDAEYIKTTLNIRLSDADVSDIVYCLKECGYVTAMFADNYACDVLLTEKAIALCEQRFENGLRAVLEDLSALKDFFL